MVLNVQILPIRAYNELFFRSYDEIFFLCTHYTIITNKKTRSKSSGISAHTFQHATRIQFRTGDMSICGCQTQTVFVCLVFSYFDYF